MKNNALKGAEVISKFCRLNINMKKDLPLRASQIGFLIYVSNNNKKKITPINAANFFGVTKAVVTKTIAPLIEKGYLEKTPSDTDKRSYTISATETAKALINDANNEYYKIMNELLLKMGREKYAMLIALLDDANHVIEKIRQ